MRRLRTAGSSPVFRSAGPCGAITSLTDLAIQQQRATLTNVAPAPLFTQQQSVLRTLVEEWDGMTADERKRMLAGIFDSVTASADGVRTTDFPSSCTRRAVVSFGSAIRILRPAKARQKATV